MSQHIDATYDVLRQVALFRELEPAQLQQVATRLQARSFRKGAIIFQQHDPGECLYIVAAGRVRIYLTSPEGQEITLRIYGAGSHFGEFAVLDGAPRSTSAAALSNTSTFVLYRDDFLNLLRNNFDLVQHVLAILTERLRYTTTFSENLAFLNAQQRVAAVLMQLVGGDINDDPVRLEITQHDLAALVCVTRESVNHTLRDYAERGWVRLERGAVVVLDYAALQRLID